MNITKGPTDCAPAEVNYDASRLDAVNAFFARFIERKVIHGVSYRLARHGKVFAAAAIGGRHYRDANVPMLPDATFGIASLTKMFTAAAIQQLVEDGLVSVDNSAAQYLPQFDGAPYNEITLFHLLTHTSGLYPDSEGTIPDKHHRDAFWHIEREFEEKGKDADWLAAGLRAGLRRKPGQEWQYCSFGLMALGAVIEKVTGARAEDFIMARICGPLGMTDTVFTPTADIACRAVIFDEWAEKWTGAALRGEVLDDGMWDILPATASGLVSTTRDVTRFGMMLANGGTLGGARILGRKAVESMSAQMLFGVPDHCWGANTAERRYGLGVDMRRFTGALTSPGTYFHEGSGHCVLIVDPVEELVCACVYPWVNGEWNADCNNRLYNVMWSGIQ